MGPLLLSGLSLWSLLQTQPDVTSLAICLLHLWPTRGLTEKLRDMRSLPLMGSVINTPLAAGRIFLSGLWGSWLSTPASTGSLASWFQGLPSSLYRKRSCETWWQGHFNLCCGILTDRNISFGLKHRAISNEDLSGPSVWYGAGSVTVSIFLHTDVPVVFDSTDHTHTQVCLSCSWACGKGAAKPSLICTSVPLKGKEIEMKELRFPFMCLQETHCSPGLKQN